MKEKVLLLLSGGLDSSVLLNYLQAQEHLELKALFFDRDQGNLVYEKQAAEYVSRKAGVPLHYVSIRDWRDAIRQFEKPAEGSLILKIPRNAMMILLATPFVIAYGCTKIAIGSSGDDKATPDSNEKFIESINDLLETVKIVVDGPENLKTGVRVIAPFLYLGFKKKDIVRWAFKNLGEEFVDKLRSCYEATAQPCGKCSACAKRARAVREVQTELADSGGD